MAGSAFVLEDQSLFSRLERKLYILEQQLSLLSGLAVFSLMILAVLSVGGRSLFNQPVSGYVDWIEQAMPLIAFMGISYTQRDGGHIRMDMLVGKLKGRPLYLFEFITVLAIFIFMVLMVWGSWAHFTRSFDFSAPLWSRDSSLDIALPLWPAKLLAPIAFAVLCLRLMLQLWGYGRLLIMGSKTPIGVPLILSVEEQAEMEAKLVASPMSSNEEGVR